MTSLTDTHHMLASKTVQFQCRWKYPEIQRGGYHSSLVLRRPGNPVVMTPLRLSMTTPTPDSQNLVNILNFTTLPRWNQNPLSLCSDHNWKDCSFLIWRSWFRCLLLLVETTRGQACVFLLAPLSRSHHSPWSVPVLRPILLQCPGTDMKPGALTRGSNDYSTVAGKSFGMLQVLLPLKVSLTISPQPVVQEVAQLSSQA